MIESSHEEIRTHQAMLILEQLSPAALEEILRATKQLPAPADADGVDAAANTLAVSSALTAESEKSAHARSDLSNTGVRQHFAPDSGGIPSLQVRFLTPNGCRKAHSGRVERSCYRPFHFADAEP